jgi:hypothetical protein
MANRLGYVRKRKLCEWYKDLIHDEEAKKAERKAKRKAERKAER